MIMSATPTQFVEATTAGKLRDYGTAKTTAVSKDAPQHTPAHMQMDTAQGTVTVNGMGIMSATPT